MEKHSAIRTPQSALDRSAAIRHAVYRDLLDYLPVASYEQAVVFVSNLALCRGIAASDPAARQRCLNSALMRFVGLRVTPGDGETVYRGATIKEIERWLNKKYGEHLQHVPGLYARVTSERSQVTGSDPVTRHPSPVTHAPFRLNLPWKCAAYGYRSATGFYNGILFQPLDRLNSYFLLSSSKFGGAKAIGLTPRDQQYFTQFEEVTI